MPIHPKFGAAVKALAAKNADPAVIKDILDERGRPGEIRRQYAAEGRAFPRSDQP